MADYIEYNGRKYFKHPKQKYYYVGNKRSNYSRSLHRQMWFDHYGEIPHGLQVHHINGDAFDNRIENLELVDRSKHMKSHIEDRVRKSPEYFKLLAKKGREYAPKWHASPEGIEWHRQNAINCGFGTRVYGETECKECGTKFIKKAFTAKFCKNSCKSNWRRKNTPDLIEANCIVCSKPFTTFKYQKKRYCSRECRPIPNPYGMNGKPVV